MGSPDFFLSDNVPFNSVKFKQFAFEWSFNLLNSSLRHPQSNGFVESGTANRILKKFHDEGRAGDFHLALLEHRNTPLAHLHGYPAQLLLGRVLKSRLPTKLDLLVPKINLIRF